MISKIISWVFYPIVFALGFLAPLIAQSMTLVDVSIPGIPNIVIGLVVASSLGLMAHFRGSWLWIK